MISRGTKRSIPTVLLAIASSAGLPACYTGGDPSPSEDSVNEQALSAEPTSGAEQTHTEARPQPSILLSEVRLSSGLALQVERDVDVPKGPDAVPHSKLTLRGHLGNDDRSDRTLIARRALTYATAEDRVAYVDQAKRLLVARDDGVTLAIAEHVSSRPAWSSQGDLLYAVEQEHRAEIREREASGTERVIADGMASAGVLSPQPDGSLLFVGSRNGGVAGLWLVTPARELRCLTNCELRTGQPWGDAYIPPPGAPSQIRVTGGHVYWKTPGGEPVSVSLLEAR